MTERALENPLFHKRQYMDILTSESQYEPNDTVSWRKTFHPCRIEAWGHVFRTVEAINGIKQCTMATSRQPKKSLPHVLKAKYLSKGIKEKTVMSALWRIKFRDARQRKYMLDTQDAWNGTEYAW